MKLIPHCRRVKIRIESNGRSCGTLDALKANFNIEDIIPLVEDGRLKRWLEDLNENTLASSLPGISPSESLTEIGKKVLIAFFPEDFKEDEGVIDSILNLQNKKQDPDPNPNPKRLLHLIKFFKEELSEDKVLDNWDSLMAYYGEDLMEIVSLFDKSDKEKGTKWREFTVLQDRKQLLQSPESKEYPTTAKKLGDFIVSNKYLKIKNEALLSFYKDVNYMYLVMSQSNRPYLEFNDYRQMSIRLHDTKNANDPFEFERNFIISLIEWHQKGSFYPQNNMPYKKAVQLSKKRPTPQNRRGNIDFILNDQTPFESMTLWKQILYVTVNIFNKNLYPDWK